MTCWENSSHKEIKVRLISVSSKTNSGNFFEDFTLGQTIQHATPRTLTNGDAALYTGLTGSRFVLQSSAVTAKNYGFQQIPLDNLLVFHIAFGKTVADISLNAVANLGYADVKFLHPVFAGDTLSVHSEIIGIRENSHGRSGIVYVHSTAVNQDNEIVLSWNRWVMVAKHDVEAAPPEAHIPKLPEYVSETDLPIPEALNFSDFNTVESGCDYYWDDYGVGERIDHGNGMTIDNTEHTMATKLYQNNARVHFDEVYMNGSNFRRRLMYGGHVISICRAISHNGLGNALLIAAINGGVHAAPTFAGDTLYAFSEVKQKWEINRSKKVAALRIKTYGVKNLPSTEIDSPYSEVEGEKLLKPEIVLALDYTVLMPMK